jgi:hypothetical protein
MTSTLPTGPKVKKLKTRIKKNKPQEGTMEKLVKHTNGQWELLEKAKAPSFQPGSKIRINKGVTGRGYEVHETTEGGDTVVHPNVGFGHLDKMVEAGGHKDRLLRMHDSKRPNMYLHHEAEVKRREGKNYSKSGGHTKYTVQTLHPIGEHHSVSTGKLEKSDEHLYFGEKLEKGRGGVMIFNEQGFFGHDDAAKIKQKQDLVFGSAHRDKLKQLKGAELDSTLEEAHKAGKHHTIKFIAAHNPNVTEEHRKKYEEALKKSDKKFNKAEPLEKPPVSEAQRKAMWAAAKGKSQLGIPQSVGKEFAEKDPGGKLPKKVSKEELKLSANGQWDIKEIKKEDMEKQSDGFVVAQPSTPVLGPN